MQDEPQHHAGKPASLGAPLNLWIENLEINIVIFTST